MFFPASALLLDYALEQFPGEGYLRELQGRKEEHSDTARSGGPGIRLLCVWKRDVFCPGSEL